jgi:hypothetical protein
MTRGIVVCIVTGYGLDDCGVGVRAPVVKKFNFSISSRTALDRSEPPIHWMPRALSRGKEAGT